MCIQLQKVWNIPDLLYLLSPQVHLSDPEDITKKQKDKNIQFYHSFNQIQTGTMKYTASQNHAMSVQQ